MGRRVGGEPWIAQRRVQNKWTAKDEGDSRENGASDGRRRREETIGRRNETGMGVKIYTDGEGRV